MVHHSKCYEDKEDMSLSVSCSICQANQMWARCRRLCAEAVSVTLTTWSAYSRLYEKLEPFRALCSAINHTIRRWRSRLLLAFEQTGDILSADFRRILSFLQMFTWQSRPRSILGGLTKNQFDIALVMLNFVKIIWHCLQENYRYLQKLVFSRRSVVWIYAFAVSLYSIVY